MVVTELHRITADPAGAAGKLWRRLGRDEWQTLTEALDNPDGDRLYAMQRQEVTRRQAEREAAEREAQRPVCTRCGNKFTDDRWQEATRSSWPGESGRLRGPCASKPPTVQRLSGSCAAKRRKPNARPSKHRW